MDLVLFFGVIAILAFLWTSLGFIVAGYGAYRGESLSVKPWGIGLWIVSLSYIVAWIVS